MAKTLPAFREGDRVQTHPATDAWLRGLRYGTVTKVGRKFVYVRLDAGELRPFGPYNILHADFEVSDPLIFVDGFRRRA